MATRTTIAVSTAVTPGSVATTPVWNASKVFVVAEERLDDDLRPPQRQAEVAHLAAPAELLDDGVEVLRVAG